MSESDIAAAPGGELALDPFTFQPGKASAIQGLGGAARHENPAYAFHTEYVHAAEGPCNFSVRFTGLAARTGTLQLSVHLMVEEDGRARHMVGNSARIQFNRLVQLGGETSIAFEGFRRVRYALYGSILGGTDARAEDLLITLDRAGTADAGEEAAAELRNSDYGQDATSAVPMMVSVAEPTLAIPTCQPATHAQAREPVYAEWCTRLGQPADADRWRWSAAYVLQTLRVFGMLAKGARGLGFGTGAEPMIAALDGFGVDIAAPTLPGSPDALPGGLLNQDFLWSIDAITAAGDEHIPGYVQALARCLRPGGIAVHVLPYVPGRDQRARAFGSGTVYRSDIERLALTMISRNLEVGQLKIVSDQPIRGDTDTTPPIAGVGAYGLVFRKPVVLGG